MFNKVRANFVSENRKSKLVSVLIVIMGFTFAFVARLLTQMVIASRYGASEYFDAYNVAMILPNLFTLVLAGSLERVLLPIVADVKVKEGETGKKLFINSVLSLFTALLLLFVVFSILSSSWLIPLISPGFELETSVLAVNLSRILFLALIPTGLITVLSTMYYVENQFTLPTIADVGRALIYLFGVMVFTKIWGIYGLAIAFILAASGKLLILGRSSTFSEFRFNFRVQHPAIAALIKLWVSIMLVQLLAQVYTLVDRYYGSLIGVGAISYIAYAIALIELPNSLIAYSIGLVYFPDLSREVAANNFPRVKEIMLSALKAVFIFGVPALIAIVVLREPLIRILLQRGNFGAIDTLNTANVLLFYAGYAFGGMVGNITSRVLWALKDWRFTLFLAIINLTVYTICIGWLVNHLGKEGIGLTASIVFNLSWVIQAIYIRSKVGSFSLIRRIRSLFKYGICIVSFVAGSLVTDTLIRSLITKTSSLAELVIIVVVVIIGYISLIITAKALNISFVNDLIQRFVGISRQKIVI